MRLYSAIVMLSLACLVLGNALDEQPSWLESRTDKRAVRTRHGYTLITTDLGNGRFKCECIDPKGRKIWPGACGSYDKTLGFINCV